MKTVRHPYGIRKSKTSDLQRIKNDIDQHNVVCEFLTIKYHEARAAFVKQSTIRTRKVYVHARDSLAAAKKLKKAKEVFYVNAQSFGFK